MQPVAPNLSRLFHLHHAQEFVISLLKFRCGITIIISGKEDAITFSAVGPREVFVAFEDSIKQPKRSWAERRWSAFLDKRVRTANVDK